MERTEAVLALGRSLLDYLPQARQPSSTLATTPGLAPGKTAPCTACGAKGRVGPKGKPCASCTSLVGPRSPQANEGGHGCRVCLVCNGSGWRRRQPGDEAWDEYARVEIASGDVGEGTEGDDLERRLARTTRLLETWEKPDSVAFAWEERHRAQFAAGDYANLVVALRKLEIVFPGRHRLWWSQIVVKDGKRLDDGTQQRLEETTAVLAGWMPKRTIRVPHWLRPDRLAEARKQSLWQGKTAAHGAQRQERDLEILALRLEGEWKISRIAKRYALTERRVKQIIRHNQQATASQGATP